jgi:hypothetical protein
MAMAAIESQYATILSFRVRFLKLSAWICRKPVGPTRSTRLAGDSGCISDALIVVVEPGQRSIQTAHNIKKLASDIGIKSVFIVGNKINSEQDKEFIESNLDELEVIGFISYQQDSPLVFAS